MNSLDTAKFWHECSHKVYVVFSPTPHKTQRQKTYVDHNWGGQIVNYVISIPTNSDQRVRCYSLIVNGVTLWCAMWPCGVNQWRPCSAAAAAASQQLRRSLDRDHVCDLEVWRHSSTTPPQQNSSYTPATQLEHESSNALCWEAWRLLFPQSSHLYLSSSYPHTSPYKNVPHPHRFSTPIIPVLPPIVPSTSPYLRLCPPYPSTPTVRQSSRIYQSINNGWPCPLLLPVLTSTQLLPQWFIVIMIIIVIITM